jgi:mono/diheme cytochrome c family protein
MFKRIVNVVEVLAVTAAAAFFVLLFANEPASDSSGYASPGAAVFAQNCSRCHGANGEGQLGPQLSHGKVTKAFPNASGEVAFVSKGKDGMPSFGGVLTPKEIQQVVAYTRTL